MRRSSDPGPPPERVKVLPRLRMVSSDENLFQSKHQRDVFIFFCFLLSWPAHGRTHGRTDRGTDGQVYEDSCA